MKKNISPKKHSLGFTLMETLVAISLLSIAVLGVFTAVQSGLQDSSYAKDQITAFYMAQEGMEFIKNVRDENALKSIYNINHSLAPISWLTGLTVTPALGSGPCDFGKTCRIDSHIGADNAGGIVDCSGDTGGVCKNLQQDTTSGSPTEGLYGYTAGWPVTNFKRTIQFQVVAGTTDEVTVIMTIAWTNRGVAHSFQVTESFFNR